MDRVRAGDHLRAAKAVALPVLILAFTGVAVLMFSRYLTSWRDLRALKALGGATIPFAIVVGYFYFAGALDDLWTWTVHYNYTVYMPEAKVPPRVALA